MKLKILLLASLLLLPTGCRSRTMGWGPFIPVANIFPQDSNIARHPDYNDGETLHWYTDSTFEDALQRKKYILVEAGRKV